MKASILLIQIFLLTSLAQAADQVKFTGRMDFAPGATHKEGVVGKVEVFFDSGKVTQILVTSDKTVYGKQSFPSTEQAVIEGDFSCAAPTPSPTPVASASPVVSPTPEASAGSQSFGPNTPVTQLTMVFKLKGPTHKWYYAYVGFSIDQGKTYAGTYLKAVGTFDEVQKILEQPVLVIPQDWKVVGVGAFKYVEPAP
ncbi:MAG: hypothetical protein IT289_12385 [Oligoflexia bacterium]|nr:hypothetical protein [Oligoflexia bacterium]